MLLDDLLEARIIQLGEFGQVMYIGDNVTQHLLQQEEILVGRGAGTDTLATVGHAIQARNDIADIGLAGLDAAHNLLALDLLEVEDLVQLALQQSHKVFLVIVGPRFAVGFGVVGGGLGHEIGLEGFLQVIVGNVVPVVLLDHGRAEVFAEPGELARAGCTAAGQQHTS